MWYGETVTNGKGAQSVLESLGEAVPVTAFCLPKPLLARFSAPSKEHACPRLSGEWMGVLLRWVWGRPSACARVAQTPPHCLGAWVSGTITGLWRCQWRETSTATSQVPEHVDQSRAPSSPRACLIRESPSASRPCSAHGWPLGSSRRRWWLAKLQTGPESGGESGRVCLSGMKRRVCVGLSLSVSFPPSFPSSVSFPCS